MGSLEIVFFKVKSISYTILRMKLDRYMFYNIYIEDIEWLDDEYGLYFTNETGFFIFSRVKISRKSFLTSEINIFIVKIIEFSIYYMSMVF